MMTIQLEASCSTPLNETVLYLMKRHFPRRVRRGKDGKYRVRYKDHLGDVRTVMEVELRGDHCPVVTADWRSPASRQVRSVGGMNLVIQQAEEVMAHWDESSLRRSLRL